MSKYDLKQPNRQYNDWDSIEQQILELDKRIDEAVAGTTSFENIQGEPEDNVKLKEALDNKANTSDVYNKTETDDLLQDKANVGDSYTKSEEDALLDNKANQTDLNSLEGRVDTIDDTISDIQTSLADKVDKEENKELMPTGLDETVAQHTTDLQTLQQAVANIPIIQVNVMPTPSADYIGKIVQYVGPTSQDAINGYFYQCGYDEELLAYKWMEKKVMNAAEEGGVDAYTKAETNQLLDNKQDKLTAGEGIKITGNVIMQDIINDTLSSPQTTWSSRYLESLFHSLSGLSSIEIVNERPTTPVNNTLYYIKAYEEGEEPLYEIWFYSNNTWTNFGTTAIDLTNYYTKSEVDALLANKQATLTPGQGIDITNNNIAAKIDGTTLGINDAGNIYVKSGGGGGGGGFEPTSAQLAAMNSGITQAKREDYDTSLEDVSQLKTDVTDLDTNKLDKRTEGQGLYSHNGDQQSEVEVTTSITGDADKLPTDKAVKDYVDDIADDKADKSNTYTKTETDTLLGNKLSATEADRGLDITSNKVGHSNSITVPTAKRILQATYDAQGHLTNIETEFNWSNNYTNSAENQLFTRKGANDMYVNYLKSTNGKLTKSTAITNDYSHYIKCGNIYQLSIGFQNSSEIAKDALLYTLPAAISSASIEMYIVISTTNGDTRVLQCGGSYSGNEIKAKSAIPAGYWFGNAIFIKV